MLKSQPGDLAFCLPLLHAHIVPLFSWSILKSSQKWLEMKGILPEWNAKFTECKVVLTFSFQHFDSEATENSHEIKLTMRTGEAFRNPISYIYIYEIGLRNASPVLIVSFISWEFSVASESKCWKEKVNTTLHSVNLAFHSGKMPFISSHFCELFKMDHENRGTIWAWRRGRQKAKSPGWLLSISSTWT